MQTDCKTQLEKYKEFLKYDPENIQLVMNIVHLQIELEEFNAALSLLDSYAAKKPNDPSLRYTRATILIATNALQMAIQVLEGLLNEGIDNAGVRYNLAYAQLLNGEYEAARLSLEQYALSENCDYLPAKFLLARIYHYVGELDAAISLLDEYWKLGMQGGNSKEVFAAYALMHLDNENSEDARHYAEKVLAEDEHNNEALVVMGGLAMEEYDFKEAKIYYQRAVEAHPNSGRAWLGLGLFHMGSNHDLAAAEHALQKALNEGGMSKHLGTWHALVWCQIMQNNVDKAKKSLYEALSIDHNFAETHGGLAVVAAMEGERKEASQLIKKALKLDPDSFSARFAQSLLLSMLKGKGYSQELIKKILQTSIDNETSLQDSLRKISKNILH